jgi:hypothetical protein
MTDGLKPFGEAKKLLSMLTASRRSSKEKSGAKSNNNKSNEKDLAAENEDYNSKRRKLRFATTPFVGFGTPLREEHPKGPLPSRWKNCPPSHKGIQMLELLKSIYNIIPSKTSPSPFHPSPLSLLLNYDT